MEIDFLMLGANRLKTRLRSMMKPNTGIFTEKWQKQLRGKYFEDN